MLHRENTPEEEALERMLDAIDNAKAEGLRAQDRQIAAEETDA
jgi:hypothetical protein